MLKPLSKDQGFTLIELLVVILIIGILIAVAAPSFLGQSDKANDSTIKQNLSYLYRDAKSDSTANTPQGVYRAQVDLLPALKTAEPQLANVLTDGLANATPAKGAYIVNVTSGNLTLLGTSQSGEVFVLTAQANGNYSPPTQR